MTKTLIAVAVLTATPFSAVHAAEDAEVFANLRSGIISSEDADGDNTSATAIGGKLGFISPQMSGFRAGATLYTTQKLSHDDNNEFFDSKGSGYTILGEAYIQAEFPYHQIKVGRFLFDSPHADTDDIRMIPNTFQGAMLTNTSFPILKSHWPGWIAGPVSAQTDRKISIALMTMKACLSPVSPMTALRTSVCRPGITLPTIWRAGFTLKSYMKPTRLPLVRSSVHKMMKPPTTPAMMVTSGGYWPASTLTI